MILDVDIPRDAKAPWHARRAVEQLGDSIDEDVRPDVMLLVSELVTHSVKYGDVRRAEAADRGARGRGSCASRSSTRAPGSPRRARPAMNEPGGWGLHLVEALTDRWGIYEGSTHVWFEIDR